ncbi:MAG: hypothetical protein ACLQVD_21970, partial [Capsulimonadaceae bacterium]
EVMPEQYQAERIRRADVQALLRRIHIRENTAFSLRFPEEMPCRLTVTLRDGRRLVKEKGDPARSGLLRDPFRKGRRAASRSRFRSGLPFL